MQLLLLSVLLGLGTSGISAHRHIHRDLHAHLKERDAHVVTVVDIVTSTVIQYVWEDGSPVSTAEPTQSTTSIETTSTTGRETTSTTSIEAESTSSLAAIFIQLPITTSSTISPVAAVTPVVEAKVVPISSSATSVIINPPVATTPPVVLTSEAAAAPSVAGERTFTIINSHTAPISTAHDDTVGTPTSAGGPIQPGTIAVGATATFAVQRGWIGNIAINDANFPVTPNSTLLEANFMDWFGVPRADLDVSFVNGYTVPMTCSCDGVVTAGCNLDLLALSSCPLGVVDNACANPLRADELAVAATSFFAPCQGCAWTFVNDGNADSNCQSGPIVCCVGSACPANPKQASA